MSYSLIFTESYENIEKRFLKRHPDLLDRYHKTLAILEQDPFHPSLRLHARRRGVLPDCTPSPSTYNIALL